MSGIVKRLEYGNVIVDLGRAEGIIRKVELIHSGIQKDLWAFEVEEVSVPEIKDYIGDDGLNTAENGIHVDMGEVKDVKEKNKK